MRGALLDEALETVAPIVSDVRARGDAALLEWTERLDGPRPDGLRVDRGVHGDLALVRELEDGGRAHPGQHGADRRKILDPRVQHHVASPAGGDDAGQHQLEPVHELASLLDRSPTPPEHRLRGEQRADRP